MHRAVTCLVAVLLVLLASRCTTRPVEKMATLTGTVTCPQRIALPPDAVVEVKLVEVHGGGGNKTIVEKRISNPGNVPVSFSLGYDPKMIHPGRQYAVQARILSDGKPWYVTQTVNHQIRNGRIAHADVILQPAR